MEKIAQVFIRVDIITIETNIPREEWIDFAPDLDYEFAFYMEDASGGFAHLYEPLGRPAKIEQDLRMLDKYKRPSFYEVFQNIPIYEEETLTVYRTLPEGNLFDILQACKEIISRFPFYKHERPFDPSAGKRPF